MALHELRSITIGVPDVEPVARYYEAFGLERSEDAVLSTTQGGRQLFLETAPARRLVQLVVGVDDHDDLARARASLEAADHQVSEADHAISVVEPNSRVKVVLEVAPRLVAPNVEAIPYNGAGAPTRSGTRAHGVLRQGPVQPRKLGHVVFTTTNVAATNDFFTTLIGFKVSDYIGDVGVFLRCSTDHHNLLVLEAPVVFLHHSAWQVDDIDEVGRGASALFEGHPSATSGAWVVTTQAPTSSGTSATRPATSPSTTRISTTSPRTQPGSPRSQGGKFGLYNWGPSLPTSSCKPDDLMELAEKQRIRRNRMPANPTDEEEPWVAHPPSQRAIDCGRRHCDRVLAMIATRSSAAQATTSASSGQRSHRPRLPSLPTRTSERLPGHSETGQEAAGRHHDCLSRVRCTHLRQFAKDLKASTAALGVAAHGDQRRTLLRPPSSRPLRRRWPSTPLPSSSPGRLCRISAGRSLRLRMPASPSSASGRDRRKGSGLTAVSGGPKRRRKGRSADGRLGASAQGKRRSRRLLRGARTDFSPLRWNAFDAQLKKICPTCSAVESHLSVLTYGSSAPSTVVSYLRAILAVNTTVFADRRGCHGASLGTERSGIDSHHHLRIRTVGGQLGGHQSRENSLVASGSTSTQRNGTSPMSSQRQLTHQKVAATEQEA